MSISCGNCKGRHESVGDVRNCCEAKVSAGAPAAHATWFDVMPDRGRMTPAPSSPWPSQGASDRQVKFIADLRSERGLAPESFTGDKGAASREIERLLGIKPAAARPGSPGTDQSVPVAAGRYALRVSDGVRFYKVDTPTEGRWAGRTFVNRIAGSELYPVKAPAERSTILRAIAADPKRSMLLYGTEIGECGHCGRQLTNDESRRLGIGPVCRAKMGW